MIYGITIAWKSHVSQFLLFLVVVSRHLQSILRMKTSLDVGFPPFHPSSASSLALIQSRFLIHDNRATASCAFKWTWNAQHSGRSRMEAMLKVNFQSCRTCLRWNEQEKTFNRSKTFPRIVSLSRPHCVVLRASSWCWAKSHSPIQKSHRGKIT